MESAYNQLPQPPNVLSEAAVISRMLDGLGFRFKNATEGLQVVDGPFRPVESSMSIEEVIRHIYQLLDWTKKAIDFEYQGLGNLETMEDYRQGILQLCYALSQYIGSMSKEDLNQVRIYLKRKDQYYPFWYLINGPIADALTHVGQINSWRRIAGNPCARISPFNGDKY